MKSSDILEKIQASPWSVIKYLDESRKNVASIREAQYTLIGVCIYAARIFQKNDELFDDFREMEFWHDHSQIRIENVLRYVLMYVYGNHQESTAQRARDHAIAMQDFFLSDQPVSEVVGYIKRHHGLGKLKEKAQADGLQTAESYKTPRTKSTKAKVSRGRARKEKILDFPVSESLAQQILSLPPGRHILGFEIVNDSGRISVKAVGVKTPNFQPKWKGQGRRYAGRTALQRNLPQRKMRVAN